MQSMKAVLLLGAVLSAGTVVASAQDAAQAPVTPAPQAVPAGPGMRHQADPHKMAKHLAKKLNLSKDQAAQIEPLLADRQQQMQALRADASLSQQDRRSKAMQIQQDSKSKIESVLNDSQKQQFEQMLAERREHRRHRS